MSIKEEKRVIQTEKAPSAVGPYSQGVAWGGLIFTAGQIPLEPKSGEMVSGGVEEQTDQVLKNLKEVLEEGGATLDTVLKTTIYLKDLAHFGEVNEVYGRYFGSGLPARSTVEVSALPKGALVEIDAVAFQGKGGV